MQSINELNLLNTYRYRSLSSKLISLCILSTVCALVVFYLLFQWQDWSSDRAELAEHQLGDARTLAVTASRAIEENNPRVAARVKTIFENDNQALAASYVSVSGRRLVARRPGQSAVDVEPAGGAEARTSFRGAYLETHVPVFLRGRKAGEFTLVSSQAEIQESLKRNLLSALGWALLSTVAAGAIARALVKTTLRPLGDLEKAMARVSRTKDFSMSVEPRSNDELGRLTRDFNALLAELAAYDAHLKGMMAEVTVAKDAAEEANVIKSQFLANMSHEIRTPLNGVLGMAQVMALSPLSEVQRDRLEIIQKSGDILLAVLNDLLDLSKIEAGRMELEQEPFDIDELASGAYATFTSIANASGVSFAMSIEPEAEGLWRGDSVRVRQILYNLISNALKFTSEGQVAVNIEASSPGADKALVISITDTGIGIAPETLPKLFEKFVQADNTMTRRFGGTGLGLTICRQIVELMGGTITVQSRLGEGSTFQVRLPLTWLGPTVLPAAPPAPSDGDPASEFSLDGMRILAAEDNATNQLVLKTVLHSLGLQPLIVDNGRLAVEACLRETFDLILMDIQMPELDGVAATREIRQLEARARKGRTPIVALSANAMKQQVAEYIAAGMDAHLAKPIQLDKLYATLVAARMGEPLVEKVHGAA